MTTNKSIYKHYFVSAFKSIFSSISKTIYNFVDLRNSEKACCQMMNFLQLQIFIYEYIMYFLKKHKIPVIKNIKLRKFHI